jgi:hypothetical protein
LDRAGQSTEVVGTVLEGTRLILGTKRANHVLIRLRGEHSFSLADDASYAVHERDLDGCAKVGDEKKPLPKHRPGPWLHKGAQADADTRENRR